ncbi:thioredoxin family protein [Wansuia hejianensis]|uniref:Thioredoxin family protein n=1 Tax=Wansuia hejianensis TaxID=2763667 RepID=A0A926F136_9FIRM|nr:thioredoxin family protein [Wansuia hejianensis]MBC8590029.1 thioredoxin family protein [Wansuia hejianensis]
MLNLIDSKEILEKEIIDNEMVLVYFGGKSCGVCVDMKPKVENILSKYSKIKGLYIDVEKSNKIAIGYSIFTIPAIFLFVQGKETIREVRHISIRDLDTKIDRYYNMIFG